MTFDKDQFKTIKGIFLSANDIQYQGNFTYNKNEHCEITYSVELSSPNNTKQEQLFTWNEQEQFWQCKHPELMSIQLLQAITEKIEQIEQIK